MACALMVAVPPVSREVSRTGHLKNGGILRCSIDCPAKCPAAPSKLGKGVSRCPSSLREGQGDSPGFCGFSRLVLSRAGNRSKSDEKYPSVGPLLGVQRKFLASGWNHRF